METSLTPLQARVLRVLRGLPWTLTGGGALIGYHLHHRVTRDLDLFFRGLRSLGHLPAEVELRLIRDGLVNKLNALLDRWASRDLVDVHALLATGLSLERAIADAPRKDAGFSPEPWPGSSTTCRPLRSPPTCSNFGRSSSPGCSRAEGPYPNNPPIACSAASASAYPSSSNSRV